MSDALKKLMILGKGPHAREMAAIVARINRVEPAWRLVRGDEASPTDPDVHVAFEHDWPETPEIDRRRWASLIDPSCFVDPAAEIGPGSVVYPNCFVGHKAVLAERCFVLAASVINHDAALGARVTVCSGVLLAGGVRVGSGSYLGQGCTVRQNVTLGERSLIGMGAVVLHDVQAGSVMAGNPARLLRCRRGEEASR